MVGEEMKFIRHEGGQKRRVPENWRKPRGHHNKMRLGKKGHRRPISTGYGAAQKGQVQGKPVCLIRNLAELEACPKEAGIIISAKLGMQKRLAIMKAAEEKNIPILNIKDTEAYKKAFEEKRKRQAASKAKKQAEQKKAEDQAKAKKVKEEEDKAKAADPEATEDADKKEKKEQEKVLHHKQ